MEKLILRISCHPESFVREPEECDQEWAVQMVNKCFGDLRSVLMDQIIDQHETEKRGEVY